MPHDIRGRVSLLGNALAGAVRRVVTYARFGPTRRALLRRAVALAVALALGGRTGLSVARAHELRGRWDRTVEVVVSSSSISAGETVSPSALRVELRPRSLVPAGALQEVPDGPVGVEVDIPAGEALLAGRLLDPDDPSLVPAGHVAISIEPAGAAPPTSAGDRVDLLAPPEGPTTEAVLVADDAVVLDSSDTDGSAAPGEPLSITVAVRDRDAGAAAAALLAGPVVVVVRPG